MRTADSHTTAAEAERPDVREALSRVDAHLRSLQHPDGFWKGLLETNVTMDAEDLMLREFLGVRNEEETAAAAVFIRSRQRPDGTWANFYGGPGDLSTTVEAYVALRLAGDAVDAPNMVAAAEFVRAKGGLEATRVFTHIWLALFGLWSWEEIPAIPPEVMFMPPSMPLNIYEFGCWARQTFVALSVVASYHPVRPLSFGIEELRSGVTPDQGRRTLATWRGRFLIADELARRYDKLARRGILYRHVRERALKRAEQWIVRRQEADGSWGGIQPPWVYSIIALHLRGYPLDHPVIARAFDGLDGFLVREGSARWLEACQSPIWDTALAVIALADAGAGPDDPALRTSARWLMDREVHKAGDWAIRRPDLEPGGWSFEFANLNYPDIDDTAEVVLALRKVTPEDPAALDAAVDRAIRWTEGMTSEQGAWGAFDADNVREVLYELPFCDFGAVIDPPSSDVTAHVIEMLALEPSASRQKIDDGVAWLRSEQEPDGSWFGRWGVNYVYGTGAALPALVVAGAEPDDPAIRRAVEFLEAHQNADGGWGEDIRSYDDPSWVGRGTSTASQTAWAIMALVAAGESSSRACADGVAFLCGTQRDDGGWDEQYFTGTGFPGDFYLNYHLYRLVFPISALGRYVRALEGGGQMTTPLFLAPLGIEAAAIRPGVKSAHVERLGMGPAKATAAAMRLGLNVSTETPLVLVGLGGGLTEGLRVGDVVVASSVHLLDSDLEIELPGADRTVEALTDAGLTVHAGPIVSSPKIIHGTDARTAAAARGVCVVDMESYWIATLARSHELTICRVISDLPGQDLFSLRTPSAVLRALRTIGAVARSVHHLTSSTVALRSVEEADL